MQNLAWASYEIFKKGGFTASQFLEGDYCWPFSGDCSFYIRNKLKSEILNDKKNFISNFPIYEGVGKKEGGGGAGVFVVGW